MASEEIFSALWETWTPAELQTGRAKLAGIIASLGADKDKSMREVNAFVYFVQERKEVKCWRT